ncbi:MAG: TIGR04076 family protein [Planctomycetes bacterium]|nr:TIGR04076 family protein [Planctomycetota bacterium]MBM4080129.1 TIGR04076 family protein [Planctomycetota bacterium]
MKDGLTQRSRNQTPQHEGHEDHEERHGEREAGSFLPVPSAVLRALRVLRGLRVRLLARRDDTGEPSQKIKTLGRDGVTRRELGRDTAHLLLAAGATALLGGQAPAQAPPAPEEPRPVPRRPKVKLVITVESIKGRCPVYKVGDKIVLDNGFKFNLQETTNACMHSLASVMPYHVAIAKGVEPRQMGLARKDKDDGKAYVHCLDPCDVTGGGTVTFSIERVAGT